MLLSAKFDGEWGEYHGASVTTSLMVTTCQKDDAMNKRNLRRLSCFFFAWALLAGATFGAEKNNGRLISTDLSAWKGVGGSMKAWTVKEGVLICDGSRGKEHAKWIATRETYDDFDITLEFKVAKDGNSGVFLRAPIEGNPAKAGMEVQLFDNDSSKYNKKPPLVRTGAIWNVAAPKKDMHKKAGEWQAMRIFCVGRHCSVWHNGEQVVSVNLDKHLDKAKAQPGLLRIGGHIGLQNHGTPFAFRNVRIKRVNASSK